jgi:hypothetical protein
VLVSFDGVFVSLLAMLMCGRRVLFGLSVHALTMLVRCLKMVMSSSVVCGSGMRVLDGRISCHCHYRGSFSVFIPRWRRLKPTSPAVIAPSAKEENNNKDDEKCLGIHDLQPFRCLDVVPTSFEPIYSLLPNHRIAVCDRLGNYSKTN